MMNAGLRPVMTAYYRDRHGTKYLPKARLWSWSKMHMRLTAPAGKDRHERRAKKHPVVYF
ncbi:hypothetical protein CSC3H3_17280 [Thalassospira marina]|uniref:Transposase n=1 Tax=Thalassospira marina TaxID=2048283 RepID=A0ABN5FP59_9PROT|nr:hypothetical protein CSC3H3_17280 [Thalassospira marina]